MRKTLTALIAAIAAACFSAGPATAQTDLQDIVDPAIPQDPDPSDNIEPEDIIDLSGGNNPSVGDAMERRCTEAFGRSRASESCTLASVWTDGLLVPAGSCGLNARCKTSTPGGEDRRLVHRAARRCAAPVELRRPTRRRVLLSPARAPGAEGAPGDALGDATRERTRLPRRHLGRRGAVTNALGTSGGRVHDSMGLALTASPLWYTRLLVVGRDRAPAAELAARGHRVPEGRRIEAYRAR